jgi:hypothetical protein
MRLGWSWIFICSYEFLCTFPRIEPSREWTCNFQTLFSSIYKCITIGSNCFYWSNMILLYVFTWFWTGWKCSKHGAHFILLLAVERVLGWRSGLVAALLVGWSRDRFPVMSLDFSLTYSFQPYRGPGVDSAPSENDYQENFLGVKSAGAWGW